MENQEYKPADERGKKLIDMMFAKHLQITFRVILITVLPLIVLGAVGYTLDQMFETSPILVSVGVILAFFVSQGINVIVFHKLTK